MAKFFKSNWIVVLSMGLAVLITAIISLAMELSFNNSSEGLEIESIFMLSILFVTLPCLFICLWITDKI